MSAPTLLADLDAEVLGRVLLFAAEPREIRYYLTGVHVAPCPKGQNVRLEGTNGHILYGEEDVSGTAEKDVIVRIGARGRSLLKRGHRVKVYSDLSVKITDVAGAVLYIEPQEAYADTAFPNVAQVLHTADDWHEGLIAPVNSAYLLKVLKLPGYVRFFSRKDASGQFTLNSSILFVLDGGTANGGKAFGLIMPVRGAFSPHAKVAEMLPASMLQALGKAA